MSQETAGRSLTARLYAARAPRYDRYQWAFRQHRRRAVEHLDLVAGQTVVDVACGTGLNFGAIEGRIGPEGSLVGVDLSAEMLERAEARIEESGWSNVTLVKSAVEDANLPIADAVLFSLTHDVLQSRPALENVFGTLRPKGRVASFGGKHAPRWRVPVNVAVHLIARRFITNPAGFGRPWQLLDEFAELRVEPALLGGAYHAWGRSHS